MNESAIEARNLIRLSVVEGAISGTYERLQAEACQFGLLVRIHFGERTLRWCRSCGSQRPPRAASRQ